MRTDMPSVDGYKYNMDFDWPRSPMVPRVTCVLAIDPIGVCKQKETHAQPGCKKS